MGRTKQTEPPCDPALVVIGDLITALAWPHHTRYNKPVLVTGIVRATFGHGFTLRTAGGDRCVRKQDITRIKKVAV